MKQQSEICKARSMFITRGVLNRKIIPNHIIYSWVRSKLHNISYEILSAQPKTKQNILSYDKRTTQILSILRQLNADKSIIYLINTDGIVIYSTDGENVGMPLISNFREEIIGTTAPGISIITGESVDVDGCEHYNKHLTNFISSSLVIKEDKMQNPVIIALFTPIMHRSAHLHLYSRINRQFTTEDEADDRVDHFDTLLDEKQPVNPVKTTVKIPINDEMKNVHNTSNKNDCKVFTLSVVEAETIQAAVTHYKWNLKQSAEALGIGRSTLYRKLKEYDIKK